MSLSKADQAIVNEVYNIFGIDLNHIHFSYWTTILEQKDPNYVETFKQVHPDMDPLSDILSEMQERIQKENIETQTENILDMVDDQDMDNKPMRNRPRTDIADKTIAPIQDEDTQFENEPVPPKQKSSYVQDIADYESVHGSVVPKLDKMLREAFHSSLINCRLINERLPDFGINLDSTFNNNYTYYTYWLLHDPSIDVQDTVLSRLFSEEHARWQMNNTLVVSDIARKIRAYEVQFHKTVTDSDSEQDYVGILDLPEEAQPTEDDLTLIEKYASSYPKQLIKEGGLESKSPKLYLAYLALNKVVYSTVGADAYKRNEEKLHSVDYVAVQKRIAEGKDRGLPTSLVMTSALEELNPDMTEEQRKALDIANTTTASPDIEQDPNVQSLGAKLASFCNRGTELKYEVKDYVNGQVNDFKQSRDPRARVDALVRAGIITREEADGLLELSKTDNESFQRTMVGLEDQLHENNVAKNKAHRQAAAAAVAAGVGTAGAAMASGARKVSNMIKDSDDELDPVYEQPNYTQPPRYSDGYTNEQLDELAKTNPQRYNDIIADRRRQDELQMHAADRNFEAQQQARQLQHEAAQANADRKEARRRAKLDSRRANMQANTYNNNPYNYGYNQQPQRQGFMSSIFGNRNNQDYYNNPYGNAGYNNTYGNNYNSPYGDGYTQQGYNDRSPMKAITGKSIPVVLVIIVTIACYIISFRKGVFCTVGAIMSLIGLLGKQDGNRPVQQEDGSITPPNNKGAWALIFFGALIMFISFFL